VQRRGYLQRILVGGAALWWFLWFYVAVWSCFSSKSDVGSRPASRWARPNDNPTPKT